MDAESIAKTWIAQWNARDVEGVLETFADDVVFRSQKAHDIVGTGEIKGKDALRAYWNKALDQVGELRFDLDHAAFDERRQELFIVYIATLGAKRNHACERLRFAFGRVVEGEAFYGAGAPA
jgi:ketosteroid isomerase-like protein